VNISAASSHIGVPTESASTQSLNVAQRALIQAVKAVNPTELFGENHAFQYQIDRKSNTVLVRIVNKKTGELVNQIPAEYLLRLAEESKEG
jgi:uncharacterized FlaG/YvyC family protein